MKTEIIYFVNNKYVCGQVLVNALSFQIIIGFISYACSQKNKQSNPMGSNSF